MKLQLLLQLGSKYIYIYICRAQYLCAVPWLFDASTKLSASDRQNSRESSRLLYIARCHKVAEPGSTRPAPGETWHLRLIARADPRHERLLQPLHHNRLASYPGFGGGEKRTPGTHCLRIRLIRSPFFIDDIFARVGFRP